MSLLHLHKRKRLSGKAFHPYPANSLRLRILDKVVYASGIIALGMMIPQLKLIYVGKVTAGLEPITWITLAILNIPWIIYGLVHKEGPIALTSAGWLIVNALVFTGTVLY